MEKDTYIYYGDSKISLKRLMDGLNRNKVKDIPAHLAQYPMTPDECYIGSTIKRLYGKDTGTTQSVE